MVIRDLLTRSHSHVTLATATRCLCSVSNPWRQRPLSCAALSFTLRPSSSSFSHFLPQVTWQHIRTLGKGASSFSPLLHPSSSLPHITYLPSLAPVAERSLEVQTCAASFSRSVLRGTARTLSSRGKVIAPAHLPACDRNLASACSSSSPQNFSLPFQSAWNELTGASNYAAAVTRVART